MVESFDGVYNATSKCRHKAASSKASVCICVATFWSPSSIRARIIKPVPFTIANDGCYTQTLCEKMRNVFHSAIEQQQKMDRSDANKPEIVWTWLGLDSPPSQAMHRTVCCRWFRCTAHTMQMLENPTSTIAPMHRYPNSHAPSMYSINSPETISMTAVTICSIALAWDWNRRLRNASTNLAYR